MITLKFSAGLNPPGTLENIQIGDRVFLEIYWCDRPVIVIGKDNHKIYFWSHENGNNRFGTWIICT